MVANARHKEVVDRVIELIKNAGVPGINSDQVYLARFPFYTAPSIGLAVSMLNESEGRGLNELDDIAYPVQVTRILHRLHPNDGLGDTSLWRDSMRRLFNRTRIGVGCELVTRCEFATIEIPKQWEQWNIDSSVLRITTLIRETRTV